MKNHPHPWLAILVMVVPSLVLPSCAHFLEDDATHLAHVMEKGSKKLAASPDKEITLEYQPLAGSDKTYHILINRCTRLGPPAPPGSSLYVQDIAPPDTQSTTTYHLNFVTIPRKLEITKSHASALVVLRKVPQGIEVADLR